MARASSRARLTAQGVNAPMLVLTATSSALPQAQAGPRELVEDLPAVDDLARSALVRAGAPDEGR